MIATAANGDELRRWALRQSELRHSLQPSPEAWESLKGEIGRRIDELTDDDDLIALFGEEEDRPAAEEPTIDGNKLLLLRQAYPDVPDEILAKDCVLPRPDDPAELAEESGAPN